MNRRVLWAVVGSVLVHLGLIGGLPWQGLMGSLRDRPPGKATELPRVIRARLLSEPSAPGAASAAEGAPQPSVQRVARPRAFVKLAQRPAAPHGPREHDQPVAESVLPVGAVPLAENVSAEGGPPKDQPVHKPLVLDLPAKGYSRAPGASAPLDGALSARPRPTPDPVGRVAIQETKGSMGERRATVTTPWGRYCMRERRPSGPYDARRDRGMDSVTCPDG